MFTTVLPQFSVGLPQFSLVFESSNTGAFSKHRPLLGTAFLLPGIAEVAELTVHALELEDPMEKWRIGKFGGTLISGNLHLSNGYEWI